MKVILILGAAVWQNGPSPTLWRRCNHAISLWQQDESQVLVGCGGLGAHPPTEAEAMRRIFRDSGVPDTQILCENTSTTTFENIENAVEIIGSPAAVTIVTDRYHCPRAWMVARYFGLRPRMSAPSLRGTHIPTQIRQHLRELGAIPAYALRLLWRSRR